MKIKSLNRFLFLLLSAVLTESCTQNKSTKDAGFKDEMEKLSMTSVNDYLITKGRIGVINESDKKLIIIKKFGALNPSLDSFFLEGMFQEMILRVDSGKNEELEIHFDDKGNVSKIVIDDERSPYHYASGIKIGTSLYELVQLNQKPIDFYGFQWDYYGSIVELNNGKLKTDFPYFGGVLIPKKKHDYLNAKYQGDNQYSSDQMSREDQKNILLQQFQLHFKEE